MKNKNGFTLIELLAVIVILAVVSIITIPIILNVIESSKKGAIKDSAYGLIESANVYVAGNLKEGIKDSIKFTCENNKCVSDDNKEISFKGKIEKGTLIISTNNRVLVCVDDGEYYAIKDVDDQKVTAGNGTCGDYEEENGTFEIINATSETIKKYEAKIAEYEEKIEFYEELIFSDADIQINENSIVWNYIPRGTYQTFKAPVAGTYKIELWGAKGADYNSSCAGGKGGYTSGEIELEEGQILYVYVGTAASGETGGWNGGGSGYQAAYGIGRGGGGATDIRTVATSDRNVWNEEESLRSRIMVAGGGGGGHYYNHDVYISGIGGNGGGLSGTNGTSSYDSRCYGTGAGIVAAGYSSQSASKGKGGFGVGGAGRTDSGSYSASGGGSGWYGGGGTYSYGGGGGGSSYISGHNGCVGIKEDGTHNNTTAAKIEDSYSYTGFIFTNTSTTAGSNNGDGKAKITLLNYSLKK